MWIYSLCNEQNLLHLKIELTICHSVTLLEKCQTFNLFSEIVWKHIYIYVYFRILSLSWYGGDGVQMKGIFNVTPEWRYLTCLSQQILQGSKDTFREHHQRAILETCDPCNFWPLVKIHIISDNWEQQWPVVSFIETLHFRVTMDS